MINEYARKWGRDTINNFSVACYEGNTMAELAEALMAFAPDAHDLACWGLSPDEYRDAIQAALEAKKNDTQGYVE